MPDTKPLDDERPPRSDREPPRPDDPPIDDAPVPPLTTPEDTQGG